MLGDGFPYVDVGKLNQCITYTQLYSFKCDLNQSYIVELEHHPHDIYIVKFYQKNHKDSKKRYSFLNKKSFLKGKKTSGAKNFLKILNTVTDLIYGVYQKNTKASFGFLGAPTLHELNSKKNGSNINGDGTVANTKRFNTYGIYVKRYFDPKSFEHIELATSSCYLLKNKSNDDLTTAMVEKFFRNYIAN